MHARDPNANAAAIRAFLEIVREQKEYFLSLAASKPLAGKYEMPPGTANTPLPSGCLRVKARPGSRRGRSPEIAALSQQNVRTTSEASGLVQPLIDKTLTNRSTGMTATISKKSLDKMTKDGKAIKQSISPKLHALAVANIQKLFEQAELLQSHDDRNNNTNIARIHRFGAIFAYQGELVPLKITVKEFAQQNDPNRIYTVEVVNRNNKKNKPAGQLTPAVENQQRVVPITDFNNTLQRMFDRVKCNIGFYAELFTKTQVFHRTFSLTELPTFLEQLCGVFGNIVFRYQNPGEGFVRQAALLANNKGQFRLLETRERTTPDKTPAIRAGTERQKKYILPAGKPVPFLVHLGIMTGEGKIIAAKQGKFRQINRFLEYVDDMLPALQKTLAAADSGGERPLRVVDFGCGSSYLTFALYYFLTEMRGVKTHILGVDIKAEVIAKCAELAARLKFDGLSFRAERVEDFIARTAKTAVKGGAGEAPDLLVTLHACDTATDYALAYGIRRGVPAILSVPCCQHELNALLRPAAAALSPLMSHGLLKERFAALATDAIRVKILEDAGYAVTVAELVTEGDTPKNLLIRGTLKSRKQPKRRGEPVCPPKDSLSDALGVALTLEKLLADCQV